MKISNTFWNDWEKQNEIGKIKLVEELPMFANGRIQCPLFSPDLLNSYFEDLYRYMKEKEDGKIQKY